MSGHDRVLRPRRGYWTHRLPLLRQVRTVAVVPMMVSALAVLAWFGTPRKIVALIGSPLTSVNEPSLVNSTGLAPPRLIAPAPIGNRSGVFAGVTATKRRNSMRPSSTIVSSLVGAGVGTTAGSGTARWKLSIVAGRLNRIS